MAISSDAKKVLRDKIDQLKLSRDGLNSQINELNSRRATLIQQRDALNAQIDEFQADINS